VVESYLRVLCLLGFTQTRRLCCGAEHIASGWEGEASRAEEEKPAGVSVSLSSVQADTETQG